MKQRKLTKQQAIEKLTETRSLSTDLLEPLGISFESWLKLAQYDKKSCEKVVNDLIEYYNGDDETRRQLVGKN